MRSTGLICLPFAGGSSLVYRNWRAAGGPFAVFEAELPGRGRRANESLLYSMEDLVTDLLVSLAPQLRAERYVLFGHSFGGLLAFALAERLQREKRPMPHAVFVSGANPPHHQRPEQVHRFDNDRLVKRMITIGGMPAGLTQQSSVLERMIPMLRADLCAMETHGWPSAGAIDVPIEVIAASGDPLLDFPALPAWGNCTTQGATLHRIEADSHFYLDSHRRELLALIAERCGHHERMRTRASESTAEAP